MEQDLLSKSRVTNLKTDSIMRFSEILFAFTFLFNLNLHSQAVTQTISSVVMDR